MMNLARSLFTNATRRQRVTHFKLRSVQSAYLVFFSVLMVLPNLAYLELDSMHPALSWQHLLSLTYHFHLRAFKATVDVDSDLIKFLAKQPSITELNIVQIHTKVKLPPQILPSLDCIVGSLSQILAFVPGRPVTKVKIIGCVDDEADLVKNLIPALQLSTRAIEYLSIELFPCTATAIRLLATSFPNLAQLSLTHIVDPSPSMTEDVADWMKELASFTHLKHLSFEVIVLAGQLSHAYTYPKDLGWTESMSSLETVDFRRPDESYRKVTDGKWIISRLSVPSPICWVDDD